MIILQFSQSNNIFSLLIRLFTWSWASHVDIVIDEGTLLGARLFGGVGMVDLADQKFTRVERYAVDLGVDSAEVLRAAFSQIDKPYDIWGAIGLALHHNWESESKWFCSELVAWVFQKAGRQLLNEKKYRITPRDLLMSPYLKRIGA